MARLRRARACSGAGECHVPVRRFQGCSQRGMPAERAAPLELHSGLPRRGVRHQLRRLRPVRHDPRDRRPPMRPPRRTRVSKKAPRPRAAAALHGCVRGPSACSASLALHGRVITTTFRACCAGLAGCLPQPTVGRCSNAAHCRLLRGNDLTGQLPASLSKLSRAVYLCPLPLRARLLSCHANDPCAALHWTVERRTLARCGTAQRS